MKIIIRCPYCYRVLKSKSRLMHKKLQCPKCLKLFKLRKYYILKEEMIIEVKLEGKF